MSSAARKPAAGKKTAAAKAASSRKPVASASSSSKPSANAPKPGSFHDNHSHLFVKNTRNFGIGRAIPPKRDLTRFVKWPRYIRIQRQRAILKRRLKVPPAINQFSRALDKNQAATLFRLLAHYRPESHQEKSARLKAAAASEVSGSKTAPQQSTKPLFIKYGLNHVTDLIEQKKAKLVVIAHDVDPIELVVWLPALCRKMNVPYCIVKGKSRLGHLVYKKTVSAVAVTELRKEDGAKLEQIVSNVRTHFNDNVTERRRWGGGVVGPKAQAVVRLRERELQKEASAKLG